MTDPATDYVAVEVAGKLTGMSPRTLRHWIHTGKLAAIAGKRGKLVSITEVQRVAALAGKPIGTRTEPDSNPAGIADGIIGNLAEPPTDSALVSDAARHQLALLRDEWLLPLVDKIGALEREVGRLQTELDALKAQPAPQAHPEQPAESTPPRRPWWRWWS